MNRGDSEIERNKNQNGDNKLVDTEVLDYSGKY